MKVHMVRSETKLADRNENKHKFSNRGDNGTHTHGAVKCRGKQKRKPNHSCSREKTNQKRLRKQGRDRNEGMKVEGRGVRKTKDEGQTGK